MSLLPSVYAFPLPTSSASRSVCAHVWTIPERKYAAIEVLGHKLCTSSILFVIAKLISKWVTPIYIHSGSVREYLSPPTQQKLASYHGWEEVSHFNLHICDLFMWMSIFFFLCKYWPFDFHSLCLLFWYPLSIFSNGLFVFMVLIYRSASYIPDSILCQLFIQMSVVIWKTLFHLVKFINLILYVSCPLFTVFKETTTSLYQDHKGSLINFLSKVLLFWYLFLSDLMFVYRLK